MQLTFYDHSTAMSRQRQTEDQVKTTLPPWITRRTAVALTTIGVLLVLFAAFAYGSEIAGAICADGWESQSTNSGRCSSHGGVDENTFADTVVGQQPAGWIGVTRWPALVVGALATLTGLVGLGLGAKLGIQPAASPVTETTTDTAASSFVELAVSVYPTPTGYRVSVATPAGDQHDTQHEGPLPKNRGITQLAALVAEPDKRRVGSRNAKAVETFGTDLFNALFTNDCEAAYRNSMNIAREQNAVLRIVLSVDESLADLPWEYLFDPKRSAFLARSRETSLVRRLGTTDATRSHKPIDCLRILSMSASPKYATPLDTAAEQERIQQELASSIDAKRVQLEFVQGASLAALNEALTRFKPHVFHFAGHGAWDDDKDDGVILFADHAGFQQAVNGRDLGTLLNQSELRLVIFNSCHGARPSTNDRFAGVTSSLVAQGVPAAIGMQFAFDDKAGITFGSTLLRELGSGASVDDAVTNARIAVFSMPNDLEWGTPVLIARVPLEQVIPRKPTLTPSTASADTPTAIQPAG